MKYTKTYKNYKMIGQRFLLFSRIVIVLSACVTISFGGVSLEGRREIIVFPENEVKHVVNNRVPLFAPHYCSENELLYPGNQKADWICDCSPGYVYHPSAKGCFPIYRRGPCKQGEYLILRNGEMLPVCVSNPCINDGNVRYQGACYELDKKGPCAPTNQGEMVFGVNTTTLQPGCVLNIPLPNAPQK